MSRVIPSTSGAAATLADSGGRRASHGCLVPPAGGARRTSRTRSLIISTESDGRLAGRAAQLLASVDGRSGERARALVLSEAQVRAKLEDGRAQGKRLRRLVQWPTLCLGSAALAGAVVMFVLLHRTTYGSVPALLMPPTVLMLLLSLLPSDRMAIIWVNIALALLAAVLAIMFAISLTDELRSYAACRAAAAAARRATEQQPCAVNVASLTSNLGFSLTAAIGGTRFLAGLRASRTARAMLQHVWSAWAQSLFGFATFNVTYIALAMRAGTWEDNVSDNILIALTVLLCVIGGLALRADFRTRTQAWLASRGEAVTTAASIAALIGNRPADDVQQIALRRLRCIRLDLISVDELASPQPDPLLFNKSSRCQLGQIDAFISHRCAFAPPPLPPLPPLPLPSAANRLAGGAEHRARAPPVRWPLLTPRTARPLAGAHAAHRASAGRCSRRAPPVRLRRSRPHTPRSCRSWRDDPHEKWAMMQAWRARFKAEHSREPLVWLDKACIEQGDIDANLMCLPVFLAGCSTLLVVYGPTYLSRVWCVTELFTFLQMGASADRIELLLPGPPGPSSPGSAELAVLTAPAASCAAGTPVRAAQPSLDVRGAIRAFDVRRASCFRQEEREKLLTVIEVGFGGLSVFKEVLVTLLMAAVHRHEEAQLAEHRRAPKRPTTSSPPLPCTALPPLLQRLPLRSPSPSKSQSVAGEATIASHYSVEGILGKAAARLSMGGNRQSGGFARASTARGSNGSLAVRVSDMTAGSR